ncbi:flagellar hook assembly protein FlgD [Ahrensia sp. R2A130]|uniref:flagellar hook assembly protein FlgD n=1 Tax=Ahrensia sp. R2A130 TaxID=744979 RepID=UPI0001E0F867|nr:flagellar hook assembly protein FlgD [Ahrensia sp. R2A130]EFL89478.1 flagellar hook capping protein [Ahrensia sp. R2A130]
MSTIDAISATSTTSTGTAQAAQKAQVDYDSFLKLLVAELENQDPTKPMESSEFVAQLATFSGVEQSIQTNTKLDALLAGNVLGQAGTMIGRTVTAGDVTGLVDSVAIESGSASLVLDDGRRVALSAVSGVS